MIEIIKGDLTNKQHTNDVVGLSLKNKFYTDQIWNMVLRKFTPQVIKRLRELGWSDARIEAERVKKMEKYDKYEWEFRLLMKDGKTIGFIFWDYPKKEGKGVCLEFLLVDPAHRENGYGKLLMDDFIVWADATRPDIKIQFDGNNMLRKFYAKYGFKEHPEKKKSNPFCPFLEWYRIK